MRTRAFRNEILLVAMLGVAAVACTITIAAQDASTGTDDDASGPAGTGGTGSGDSGTGGSSSNGTGGEGPPMSGTGGQTVAGTGGSTDMGSGGMRATGSGGNRNGTGGGTPTGTGGMTATGSGGRPGTGGSTAGTGGSMGTGGTTPGTGGAMAAKGPCDILADDGGPCVAAHSTIRALLAAYNGPLYQVKRTSDGMTKDIMVITPGGFANAADQDTFCGTGACTISIIYDQSGMGNHLTKGPAGGAKTTPDNEADAKALPVTISGHKVYGEHSPPGVGYRNNAAKGTATGDNAETEYVVLNGNYVNGQCCFDYGNMEKNSRDNGEGTMEAVYFGTCTIWGKGSGSGPWVMGDLENGLWAGNVSPFNGNTPINSTYITGMVKGDAAGKNHWAIKAGNAATGPLMKMFDGQRPNSRYNPMRKEGAIGLGTGGDNSDSGQGNFFEGVMTAHFSSDAADDAVQANINSVYGH